MKIIFYFLFFINILDAQEIIVEENNETKIESEAAIDEPFVVKDTSGKTVDEIRDEAKKVDKKIKKAEDLDQKIDSLLKGTFIEDASRELKWKELSPTQIVMIGSKQNQGSGLRAISKGCLKIG